MTLPANIRVNVGAPFPAVVKGTVGIGITRQNGIWTIGLAYPQFAVQPLPPVANYASDYVLVYDAVAKGYFLMPLAASAGGARSQRSVTSGPVIISNTDQVLNLNLTTSLTINLPLAGTRNGVPLIFKDAGLQAAAHPITLAATVPDTIDGNPFIVMNGMGQRVTLTPAADGVNSGWSL